MTNQEIVKALRNRLFADMGKDMPTAFNDVSDTIDRLCPSYNRVGMFVAVQQLLNTIANAIEANETGEMK